MCIQQDFDGTSWKHCFFKSWGGIAQLLQKQLSAKLKKIPVEKGFEHLSVYFVLGEGLCQFARE